MPEAYLESYFRSLIRSTTNVTDLLPLVVKKIAISKAKYGKQYGFASTFCLHLQSYELNFARSYPISACLFPYQEIFILYNNYQS